MEAKNSHFDLQLGYKGIFIVIFSRIEDKNRVIDEAHISSTLQAYTFAIVSKGLTLPQKTASGIECGFVSIPSHVTIGTRKLFRI